MMVVAVIGCLLIIIGTSAAGSLAALATGLAGLLGAGLEAAAGGLAAHGSDLALF